MLRVVAQLRPRGAVAAPQLGWTRVRASVRWCSGGAGQMDEQSRRIVKATAPMMAEQGYNIATLAFGRLFEKHPDLRFMFNVGHQTEIAGQPAQQPLSLACTVHAFAKYLDEPARLRPHLERIAHRHVSVGVRPQHYTLLNDYFVWAMRETLQDNATPALLQAWQQAYAHLSALLAAREQELSDCHAAQEGGWRGWRDFRVCRKDVESDRITSFYLAPVDGTRLPLHKPGQYISVVSDIPDHGPSTRQYTISSAPGSSNFRITVRRHDGEVPGLFSSHLHNNVNEGDTVRVSVPCGDFFLPSLHPTSPVCFISGGVGLTPVMSMVEALVDAECKQSLVLFDCVRDQGTEAMHKRLEALRDRCSSLTVQFVYDRPPTPQDLRGPLTVEHIQANVPGKDCDFYLSGPPDFMLGLLGGLRAWGVHESRIHFHYFGNFDYRSISTN